MRFVKAGDDVIINLETISWVEKDDYGHWLVHLAGGKAIKVKSEEFIKGLEELCTESTRHRRSSTGSTRVDVVKLTADVFDRDDCPEWAEYAAVDKDGVACFFEKEPRVGVALWVPGDTGDKYGAIPVFNSSDWKNSLIRRPSRS